MEATADTFSNILTTRENTHLIVVQDYTTNMENLELETRNMKLANLSACHARGHFVTAQYY